jgi:hypothetical protein
VVYYIINGLSSSIPFIGPGGGVASMYEAGEYVKEIINFVIGPRSQERNIDTERVSFNTSLFPHTKGISKRSFHDSCMHTFSLSSLHTKANLILCIAAQTPEKVYID